MKSTSWSRGLSVTGDGTGVVAHAGSVAVRLLGDRVGLTGALSGALVRRGFTPGHDRGRVLVDVATMLAAGGEAIADIDTLRHQGQVLGAVASPPTVWRALDELTPGSAGPGRQGAGDDAGAGVGLDPRRVAGLGGGRCHAARRCRRVGRGCHDRDREFEKEQATRTFKKTFGYHPVVVWCDNTGELLAASLRPGNAGSNTTADHIEVLSRAIAQVPASHRKKLLVRADGAGASHGLLDWLTALNTAGEHGRRGRNVEYSVGFALTEQVRQAITLVPTSAWTPAVAADGEVREHADVVEITGLLPAATRDAWPPGMRVIVRREHPHPGAQLSQFEHRDGWRYQAFATNTQLGQVGFLEARHRAHATSPARSKTGSGSPRTPAFPGSPPANTRSTRLGSPSSRSPPT